MQRVKVERSIVKEETKPMNLMKNGEIGYVEGRDYYVMRVGSDSNAKFLILGTYRGCDYYDYEISVNIKVRGLREGEKVFMEFFKRKEA